MAMKSSFANTLSSFIYRNGFPYLPCCVYNIQNTINIVYGGLFSLPRGWVSNMIKGLRNNSRTYIAVFQSWIVVRHETIGDILNGKATGGWMSIILHQITRTSTFSPHHQNQQPQYDTNATSRAPSLLFALAVSGVFRHLAPHWIWRNQINS